MATTVFDKPVGTEIATLNSNLTAINFPIKETGTYAATFAGIGTQIDANRICVFINFPFVTKNVLYAVSITSAVIIGTATIDPSTITVDNKRATGVRLMIAKTGTVNLSYPVEVTMSIAIT